jgi:hypothetical protein
MWIRLIRSIWFCGFREPLRCALIACDDGDRDARTRDAALDRKLKVYLAFVRSRQFAKHFPELSGAKILIKVICSGAPTPRMTEIEGIMMGKRACQSR